MLFLSSLGNLLLDAYNIFQNGVDYFKMEHKTCQFLVRGPVRSQRVIYFQFWLPYPFILFFMLFVLIFYEFCVNNISLYFGHVEAH